MLRLARPSVLIALLSVVVFSASADAATYYAAPGASNSEFACTTPQAAKCSLSSALGLVGSSDAIALAPGTYSTQVTKTHSDISITGPGPGSSQATILLPSGSLELGVGTSIADVRVIGNASEALRFDQNTRATRVFARGDGGAGCRVSFLPVDIVDSVCATTLDSGTVGGISFNAPSGNGDLTLVGVTAAGPQSGLGVNNAEGRRIVATNTLMYSTNHVCPLAVTQMVGRAKVTVISSHSAYELITPSSRCVSTGDGDPAKLFVSDRRDGDYVADDVTLASISSTSPDYLRLPSNSSLIDRGQDGGGSGALDAAGLPRTLGAHPDIGALEYAAPPSVSAIVPSGLTAESVSIGADVDGHGLATATTVFYGVSSTTQRQSDAVTLPRAAPAGHVEVPIGLLSPRTTYKYVLCTALFDGAANGTTCGPEKTFTTTALAPQIVGSAFDAVSPTGARLRATVNPQQDATQAHFEYGPTTTYGSTTPTVALTAGSEDQDVQSTLTGLTPGTTYHARAVSTNSGGTTTGEDLVFTTGAATAPPGAGTGQTQITPPPSTPPPTSSTTTTTTTTPPPATPATLSLGKVTATKTGRLMLTATVSASGVVLAGAGAQPPASAKQKKTHTTPPSIPYLKLSSPASAAGPLTLTIRPSAAVLRALRKHRLPVTVTVAFAPRSGAPVVTATAKVLAPKLKRIKH